jgi:DNA invertase Pin-like site-specific DNA recombinase
MSPLECAYARALGFVDSDLRQPPREEKGRPVGAWFNLQEASDFSDKRRAEIEAARRAGKLPKRLPFRSVHDRGPSGRLEPIGRVQSAVGSFAIILS